MELGLGENTKGQPSPAYGEPGRTVPAVKRCALHSYEYDGHQEGVILKDRVD